MLIQHWNMPITLKVISGRLKKSKLTNRIKVDILKTKVYKNAAVASEVTLKAPNLNKIRSIYVIYVCILIKTFSFLSSALKLKKNEKI